MSGLKYIWNLRRYFKNKCIVEKRGKAILKFLLDKLFEKSNKPRGRKIFVSYKYADKDVASLNSNKNTTVRDYVTEFENLLDDTDHIYKGESDGEDLSKLSDDTIWEKLKDRIYDSSITIVFISPKMKEDNHWERNQWIPWEISYSLKEMSRKNKNGDPVTSKTNAMLAVVLPDRNGSYSYYLEDRDCCAKRCVTHYIDKLFKILRDNKFNYKKETKTNVKMGKWSGQEHVHI